MFSFIERKCYVTKNDFSKLTSQSPILVYLYSCQDCDIHYTYLWQIFVHCKMQKYMYLLRITLRQNRNVLILRQNRIWQLSPSNKDENYIMLLWIVVYKLFTLNIVYTWHIWIALSFHNHELIPYSLNNKIYVF